MFYVKKNKAIDDLINEMTGLGFDHVSVTVDRD